MNKVHRIDYNIMEKGNKSFNMRNNYVEKNSIELLIEEIKRALDNKMFFAALTLSLILPDVLGKLEFNETWYKKWYNKYVKDHFGLTINDKENDEFVEATLDGDKCYKLRNSLFHSAGTDIEKKTQTDDFVIQLSDEPFVRGMNYYEDIDINKLKYLKVGDEVEEKCKVIKMYVSANEISNNIVDAAEKFMNNNKEKVKNIKINTRGGVMPEVFFNHIKRNANE